MKVRMSVTRNRPLTIFSLTNLPFLKEKKKRDRVNVYIKIPQINRIAYTLINLNLQFANTHVENNEHTGMGVNVTKQAKKAVNLISVGHFLRIKKKNYYNSQQAGQINLCVIYILRRIKVIAKKKN